MSQRREALWRIVAFLWGMTGAAIITSIVTFFGFFWGVTDVLWQLVTGRDDLSKRSKPATIIQATVMWNAGILVYSLTGGEEFTWIPRL